MAEASFAAGAAACASAYVGGIIAASARLDDCLGEAKDISVDELDIWLRVKDIHVFIDVESLIQQIEGLIASVTDRFMFDKFFEYLRVEDLDGAALYLKEVYEVDPVSELPDVWASLVAAVESANLADYYGNDPGF